MERRFDTNEGHEPYWSLSDTVSLASGICLKVERFALKSNTVLPFELNDSPLFFGFQIAGQTRSSFTHGGPKQPVEFAPGSNGVGYYADAAGELEYMRGKENCSVSILVRPELLAQYMECENVRHTRELDDVIEARKGTVFFKRLDTTPAKQLLLNRVLNYSNAQPLKRMFLEAACLELIALQLEECLQTKSDRRRMALTPSDRERIHAARDLLLSDLENPPTTLELARQVGINDFKLKQGFREVFGKPLYRYFRDYRLDKARFYLDEGEMNVSAAAYRVGYINLGYFSKAFYAKFGVRPKEYLQSRSHRCN